MLPSWNISHPCMRYWYPQKITINYRVYQYKSWNMPLHMTLYPNKITAFSMYFKIDVTGKTSLTWKQKPESHSQFSLLSASVLNFQVTAEIKFGLFSNRPCNILRIHDISRTCRALNSACLQLLMPAAVLIAALAWLQAWFVLCTNNWILFEVCPF
jgi:hypothetical protein